MTFGFPTEPAYDRWRQACFTYLQFLFHGAPDSAVRAAAAEVYKWSHSGWRRCDEAVH